MRITDGFKGKDFVTPKLPITTRVAENEEKYQTLPCNIEDGVVSFSFDLSDEDLRKVLENKKVYVSLITFNHPIQPIRVSVDAASFEENVQSDKKWVAEVLFSNEKYIEKSKNKKEKGEH